MRDPAENFSWTRGKIRETARWEEVELNDLAECKVSNNSYDGKERSIEVLSPLPTIHEEYTFFRCPAKYQRQRKDLSTESPLCDRPQINSLAKNSAASFLQYELHECNLVFIIPPLGVLDVTCHSHLLAKLAKSHLSTMSAARMFCLSGETLN